MSGHGPHADAHDPFQKKVALAMAIYAVLLAFVTMLTNQARTEALLLSNEANNQWSYFQSKSTKGMLVRAEADLVESLASDTTPEKVALIQKTKAHFLEESERYDHEKEGIKEKAEELAAEAEENKAKEGQFEYASVAMELGIVVATVALLLASQPAFWISILLAVAGLGWTAKTAMVSVEPKHAEVTHHAK